MLLLTPQKETPLANAVFWAVRKGNLALLQLLLNSGRVDADCRDSVCCLHAPGSSDHDPAVLVSRGAPLCPLLKNLSFLCLIPSAKLPCSQSYWNTSVHRFRICFPVRNHRANGGVLQRPLRVCQGTHHARSWHQLPERGMMGKNLAVDYIGTMSSSCIRTGELFAPSKQTNKQTSQKKP